MIRDKESFLVRKIFSLTVCKRSSRFRKIQMLPGYFTLYGGWGLLKSYFFQVEVIVSFFYPSFIEV